MLQRYPPPGPLKKWMADAEHNKTRDSNWYMLADFDEQRMDEFLVASFVVAMFLLMLTANQKVIKHITDTYFPRSLLFSVAGLFLGLIIHFGFGSDFIMEKFKGDIFLWILLPPIILEATYKLYGRDFALQFDTIIMLAVIGTLLNVFALGLVLYAMDDVFYPAAVKIVTSSNSNDIANTTEIATANTTEIATGNVPHQSFDEALSLSNYLLLSTIIAAVDPVAVLTVFNDLHVEKALSTLVLGESLLNDGVTLVIFHSLLKLESYPPEARDWSVYVIACVSFFTVSLGGLLIGIIFGMVAAFFCKLTADNLFTYEPMWLFSSVYLAFVSAEIFHWSGIMAIIGCGIAHKRYAFHNIHKNTLISVIAVTEGVAVTMETIIFLLFGVNIYSMEHNDVWPIAIFIFFMITIFRFLIVFAVGWFVNSYRYFQKLQVKHMFIISYGGLRGAVSYAMSQGLEELNNTRKEDIFKTTTLIIILLTCFLQGGTVRLLVQALGIKQEQPSSESSQEFSPYASKMEKPATSTSAKKDPLADSAFSRTVSHIIEDGMSHAVDGTKAILGKLSPRLQLIEWFDRMDKKYVMKYLCNQCDQN